jgi:hypothetical protein
MDHTFVPAKIASNKENKKSSDGIQAYPEIFSKSLNAKLPIKIQQIIHTFAEFCHIYEIMEKTQDFEGLVFCQFLGENQN